MGAPAGGIQDVVVRVDHDGVAANEVNVAFPPVSDVIAVEPRLEGEQRIAFPANARHEFLCQLLGMRKLLLGLQGLNRQKIPGKGGVKGEITEGRYRWSKQWL